MMAPERRIVPDIFKDFVAGAGVEGESAVENRSGRKNSRFGSREQGRCAVEFNTPVKMSYLLPSAPN